MRDSRYCYLEPQRKRRKHLPIKMLRRLTHVPSKGNRHSSSQKNASAVGKGIGRGPGYDGTPSTQARSGDMPVMKKRGDQCRPQTVHQKPRVATFAIFPFEMRLGDTPRIEIHFSLISFKSLAGGGTTEKVKFELPDIVKRPATKVRVRFGGFPVKVVGLMRTANYDSKHLREYQHGSWDNCASGDYVLLVNPPSRRHQEQLGVGPVDVNVKFLSIPFKGSTVNGFRFTRRTTRADWMGGEPTAAAIEETEREFEMDNSDKEFVPPPKRTPPKRTPPKRTPTRSKRRGRRSRKGGDRKGESFLHRLRCRIKLEKQRGNGKTGKRPRSEEGVEECETLSPSDVNDFLQSLCRGLKTER